jgi:spermidine/putrescine transport system permease protein
MINARVPVWAYALMLAGFIAFCVSIIYAVKKNRGMKRSIFSMPYLLWMILFTILPCILIAYYAFTNADGQFTFENFANFWDSNFAMNKQLSAMGFDSSLIGNARGTVNVDTLVFSLWMAFLCTLICLFAGYPAALFMSDHDFKMGSALVILFILPMWMNFLLRTVAWMSLLEDNGLINNVLASLGIPRLKLMYNTGAVLLGMVYNFIPFMVFPVYTSISKQDYKLTEASMDLGANKFLTFLRVTLPLSLPGVISGITMVFMPSVTTFFIPRLLGGGNTMMFGDLIESTFLTAGDWNVGSALSLVMMLLIVISLGMLRKTDPEGEGGGLI